MAKSNYYVGLEIGTSKTCMVVGEVKPDGSVKILGVGKTRSVGVRRGEIVDYNNVRNCVKTALLEAEDISDVEINSVFLAVTGQHIKGQNNTGTYRLPDHEEDIAPEHIEEARAIAQDLAIPADSSYLHTIERFYYVDGSEPTVNPLGLSGRTLKAHFHIVYGVKTAIQNSMRCVQEIPLEIEDVVFAPIASAQIALTKERKQNGALVIDFGGGTTDYALYVNGALTSSGSLPIGGDHITNDIHLVTNVSWARAEKLKCLEGNACADPSVSVGRVKVPDDIGLSDETVDRKTLNEVIRCRIEQILELLNKSLPSGFEKKLGSGIYLTGGASQMNGLGELVQEAIHPLVYKPEPPEVSGVPAYFEDPQYSTAVGLIRYAQIMEQENRRRGKFGWFGKFLRSLWPFGS